MRTEIVAKPSEVRATWSKQYERLARILANVLGKESRELVEIGCGSGQLTVPLMKQMPDSKFVLVDTFANAITAFYSKTRYEALVSNLRKTRLLGRTSIVVSDYLKWNKRQDDEVYDAIISSEFLPEIGRGEAGQFIRECYRLVRPRGVTTHSFLSSIHRNSRQKLLIEADSNPVWTRTPPKEWFSPKPELIIKELRQSGFQRTRKIKVTSHLIIKGDAAKSLLKRWHVRPSFYEAHRSQLNRSGLEIPDWIIVSGIKP